MNEAEMRHFAMLFSDPSPADLLSQLRKLVEDYESGKAGAFFGDHFRTMYLTDPFVHAWTEKTIRTYKLIVKTFGPLVIPTCPCGSERFTDRLVGDETITVCSECGRERNEP